MKCFGRHFYEDEEVSEVVCEESILSEISQEYNQMFAKEFQKAVELGERRENMVDAGCQVEGDLWRGQDMGLAESMTYVIDAPTDIIMTPGPRAKRGDYMVSGAKKGPGFRASPDRNVLERTQDNSMNQSGEVGEGYSHSAKYIREDKNMQRFITNNYLYSHSGIW
jgi:hypothetical protein